MEKQQYKSPDTLTEKEKWDSLNISGKVQYIWDYYKLPIIIFFIILYAISYSVYRHATHKDVALYTALVNVSVGESLQEQLTDQFLETQGIDILKNKFTLYTGWYLTDDEMSEYHEYTYATRMKILGAIDAEQLDVILMNKEAFDAFSQNGYLYNLEELLTDMNPGLYQSLQSNLVTNTEILKDNSQDIIFDSSLEYVAETEAYPMAVDLQSSNIIKNAGFSDTVYFGIIKNTPRINTAVQYLGYLFS